jgi:hypothetical protein
MLSDRAAVAVFAVPTVVLTAGFVTIAIGTRTEEAIGFIVFVMLGLGLLGFTSLRSLTIKQTKEYEPTFQAIAGKFGGQVARNILGDRMVRLPHARGRVEVEYRVYSHDGEQHTPYTRFALVLPEGSLPRVRRDMLMNPKIVKKLGPTTRAEVEAIGCKVRLLGRGKAPSVEAWVAGWLDVSEATKVLEKDLPRLEVLASHPWTV